MNVMGLFFALFLLPVVIVLAYKKCKRSRWKLPALPNKVTGGSGKWRRHHGNQHYEKVLNGCESSVDEDKVLVESDDSEDEIELEPAVIFGEERRRLLNEMTT